MQSETTNHSIFMNDSVNPQDLPNSKFYDEATDILDFNTDNKHSSKSQRNNGGNRRNNNRNNQG